MQKPSLLVIVGPTASGKTALAVECAKKFNGEIISADSMQIYKGMSIATAKPTASEMQGIPHHLIDFLDVASQYSVAQFVSDAESCCEDIISRGKLPVLAGGTGLYVDSFVNNIKFSEADSDEELRKKLSDELTPNMLQNYIRTMKSVLSEPLKYTLLREKHLPKRLRSQGLSRQNTTAALSV